MIVKDKQNRHVVYAHIVTSLWTCVDVEDKRKRCVAFEDAAKRLLKYLEDGEDLKVGLSSFIHALMVSKMKETPQ